MFEMYLMFILVYLTIFIQSFTQGKEYYYILPVQKRKNWIIGVHLRLVPWMLQQNDRRRCWRPYRW